MKYKVENRSGLYVNGVAYPGGLWSGGGYTIEYVDPVVNITRFPYDEIDTVIYDDSNTFIEFNELVGTSTDSNVLVATQYDGYGVANHYQYSDGELNTSVESYVPVMTSNTTPSGIAFGSANVSTYYPWRAFNGSTSGSADRFISAVGLNYPIIVGYINDERVYVNKYIVSCDYTTQTRAPSDWTFQGSNDTTTGLDGTWDILDTRTDEPYWNSSSRTFTTQFNNTYKAYRMHITDAAASSDYVTISRFDLVIGEYDDTELIGLSNISAEFEFSNIAMDTLTVADTLVTSSPIQDGDNLVIVKDDDSIHELVASGVVESTIIADGSTNTSTDYTPFTEDLIAYYGTNATNSQKVLFNPSTYTGGVHSFYAPYYFTGELATAKVINKYKIDQSVAGGQKMIGGWNIEGSHDNSNWDTLDSKSPGWGSAAYNGLWISFENATAYKYYRVYVTNSNFVYKTNNAGIGFCHMIQADGEPASMDTSVVTQGEIPSKTYTVDVKSEFAISDAYIEAEIVNSEYNVSTPSEDGANNPSTTIATPNMTASTHSDGLAFSNGTLGPITSYGPWKAFNQSTATTSNWIVYKSNFPATLGFIWNDGRPRYINKYYVGNETNATSRSIRNWTFEGSNDTTDGANGTWDVLQTVVGGATNAYHTTKYDGRYIAFRLVVTANAGSSTYAGACLFNMYEATELQPVLEGEIFYDNIIDVAASPSVTPKVTIKSTGDKMNRMKFTTLKENT